MIYLIKKQNGVVLAIALIFLTVISILAITTLKNATSSESISGIARSSELATQAADIALRHCESSAIRFALNNSGNFTATAATYPTTFNPANISNANTDNWQQHTTWDSGTAATVFVLPAALVGGTTTYQRPPECMIELRTTGVTGANVVLPASFIITARGFGPEVAAGTGRPQGSVVWLQSTIDVQ